MTNDVSDIMRLLREVKDPEIPVLSVVDMGIVRKVETDESGRVHVTITPTYSGCPAMNVIAMQIRMQLLAAGFKDVVVHTVLSPPWTTDWMTEEGKRKLREYGITPPVGRAGEDEDLPVACPRCGSHHTEEVSRFGSTACKALYRCLDCLEPFDYFKCH